MSYPKPNINLILGDAFLVEQLREHKEGGLYVVDCGPTGPGRYMIAKLQKDSVTPVLHDLLTHCGELVNVGDHRTCWEILGAKNGGRP